MFDSSPSLSIILVAFNERERLVHVLDLLSKEFPVQPQVIVVDNASVDGTSDVVRKRYPWVHLQRLEKNIMYGKGNNVGIAVATGTLIMILNPDVEWQPGVLKSFVDHMVGRTEIDLAAPRLLYPDGRVQVSAHRRFPNLGTTFIEYCLPLQQLFLRFGYHPHLLSSRAHESTRPIAHATGVCLLVKRTVIDRIGDFDRDFTMYLEETDWERRMANAGFSRWLLGSYTMIHYGSAQKTFAQASKHYLWGLRLYSCKHWSARARLFIQPTIWLATLLTMIVLLIAWPLSLVSRRVRRRVQHYLYQYTKLVVQLLRYPRQSPPS